MLSFWNWVFFCKGHQFLSLGRFQVLQVTLWGLYLTLEGWGKSWLQESSSHTRQSGWQMVSLHSFGSFSLQSFGCGEEQVYELVVLCR